jgi:hypothetical protein
MRLLLGGIPQQAIRLKKWTEFFITQVSTDMFICLALATRANKWLIVKFGSKLNFFDWLLLSQLTRAITVAYATCMACCSGIFAYFAMLDTSVSSQSLVVCLTHFFPSIWRLC